MLDLWLIQQGVRRGFLIDYKTVQYGYEVGEKEDTFRPENWGKDVAFRPLQHCFTSLSQVQTNLTSDTETTDINAIKWLEKIKKLAEHNTTPSKKIKMKTSRNPVINFWVGPVLWSCFGLFMSDEAPFPTPSYLSFMAVIGPSCEEEEFSGFSRKWALASIFPAQHEKAHITKDLHICQRFGAEGKEEEGGGKKKALYYISKVQTQSWAFLA